MSHRNLSVELFRPKFDYPETTSLIQRLDCNETVFSTLLEGASDSRWYRIINSLLWHWRGVPMLEIDDVLSRIAVSDKKHSNEHWLDSVIGYQSGNWIYEFMSQAAQWQAKSDGINQAELSNEDKLQLHQNWLIASRLYSIASYPHYKTDDLAAQAQVLAYRAYKEALEYSAFTLKEIDFKVDNNTIKGMLHLPASQSNDPCPIVFMCGGLSNLQIDFYRYFAEFLAPNGIGLLTVDLPSVGLSRALNLSQNTSQIHQAVLEQLSSVPWVDHTKVILAGTRFGANIATRLAYLAPNRIKGMLCFAPVVHQLWVDKTVQQSLPTMYKDVIASRLGLNRISNQQLAAELNYFSLKNQGLINRPCAVPVMTVVFENDKLSTLAEAKLITSSKQNKIIKVASTPLKQSLQKALEQSTDWLKTLIK